MVPTDMHITRDPTGATGTGLTDTGTIIEKCHWDPARAWSDARMRAVCTLPRASVTSTGPFVWVVPIRPDFPWGGRGKARTLRLLPPDLVRTLQDPSASGRFIHHQAEIVVLGRLRQTVK
jgi:hypothetical protein